MGMVAQACEQVEQAKQQEQGADDNANGRTAEHKHLDNSDANKHEAHAHIHSRGVQAAQPGIGRPTGAEAIEGG